MSIGTMIQVFKRMPNGEVECTDGMYVHGDYNAWRWLLKDAREEVGEDELPLLDVAEIIACECGVGPGVIRMGRLQHWDGHCEMLIDITDRQWKVYSWRVYKSWTFKGAKYLPLEALDLLPANRVVGYSNGER